MATQRDCRPIHMTTMVDGVEVIIPAYELVDEEELAAADLLDDDPADFEEDCEAPAYEDDGLLHIDNKTSRESV